MKRWAALFALMLAGESIYLLPYLRRTFQTSIEAVYGLSAQQLGQLHTTFGVFALLCYFPGGWLADRLPPRHLMTFSLAATGLGALVMLGQPSLGTLYALHAYWGVTTILAFWPALVKAARAWGDSQQQGLGFGLLDSGRGLTAALVASLATYLFTRPGPLAARLDAVLWVYGLAPVVAAACIWITVPTVLPGESAQRSTPRAGALARANACLRMPEAWLLSVVIFAAYWLFLGSFELPAYAEHVHGRSKSFGAVLGTVRDWLRPFAAVAAGLLADRRRGSGILAGAFAVSALICASFSWSARADLAPAMLLWLQVVALATCVFALRAIYYVLLEEGRIPRALTGTTVGFVSVVGYMPDTFAFLVSGNLIGDGAAQGYRYYFAVLAGVALLGLTAALLFWRRTVRTDAAAHTPGSG